VLGDPATAAVPDLRIGIRVCVRDLADAFGLHRPMIDLLQPRAPRSGPEALELLGRAPGPEQAAALSKAKIATVLRRNRRRDVEAKAERIHAALQAPALRQPAAMARAYATIVASQVRLLTTLAGDVAELETAVEQGFGQHPDADIYQPTTSQPGLGAVLGARVLSEFGDDPTRYTNAKARKNYAGTSPITRASGKKLLVLARYARNDRLGDAVHQWAFCSLKGSPGAKAYYQALRARGIGHQAALRQLGNRLVGILHGCLKPTPPTTRTPPGPTT
jgi:hypothetical protein